MKFKILLVLVVLFQLYPTNAQNSEPRKLDSLVNLAISLSNEALYDARFHEAKAAVSLEYFRNYKELKSKHQILLTIQDLRIDRFMVIIYRKKSNPEEYFRRLKSFHSYINKTDEKELKASYFLAYSSVHRAMKNIDSSLIYEKKALQLFNESQKLNKVAEIQATIISRKHIQYLNQGKKDEIVKLIPNYIKEIEFSETHSKYALSYNTRHLAQIYRRQTLEYQKALELFEKSLLIRENIGFKPFLPASYSSIGDVYLKLGNYKGAEKMYLKSVKLADEIGFVRYQCNSNISIGDTYLLQKNKTKAIEYYSKALKSASLNNYIEGINTAIEKISSLKN